MRLTTANRCPVNRGTEPLFQTENTAILEFKVELTENVRVINSG